MLIHRGSSGDQLLNRLWCAKIQPVAIWRAGESAEVDTANIERPPRKDRIFGVLLAADLASAALHVVHRKMGFKTDRRILYCAHVLPIPGGHQTQKQQPREHCDAWP